LAFATLDPHPPRRAIARNYAIAVRADSPVIEGITPETADRSLFFCGDVPQDLALSHGDDKCCLPQTNLPARCHGKRRMPAHKPLILLYFFGREKNWKKLKKV
jgi:hypothetical protein